MQVIKDLFSSKKFVAMLLGIVVTLLSKVGLDVEPEVQEHLINLTMVYIGAQGVADAGKSFAQAKAPATPAGPLTSGSTPPPITP